MNELFRRLLSSCLQSQSLCSWYLPVCTSTAFVSQITCMHGMKYERVCLYGCNRLVSLITTSQSQQNEDVGH